MMPNKSKVVISTIFIMLLVPTFGSSSSITFAISDNILSIHLLKGYADEKLAFFIATASSI